MSHLLASSPLSTSSFPPSSSPFFLFSFRPFLFLSYFPFVFLSFRLHFRCYSGDRARQNGIPSPKPNSRMSSSLFLPLSLLTFGNRLAAVMAHLPVTETGSLHVFVVFPFFCTVATSNGRYFGAPTSRLEF